MDPDAPVIATTIFLLLIKTKLNKKGSNKKYSTPTSTYEKHALGEGITKVARVLLTTREKY